MGATTFVLDLEANPHPDLRIRALALRRQAREAVIAWENYRASMCDATGLPPEEMDAWLDHHETGRAAT